MAELHSFVSLQVPGVHNWPDAPDRRAYLRNAHRHQFHIRVTFPQQDDRGIEFHEYQQYVSEILRSTYGRTGPHSAYMDFQDKSCEAIAASLGRALLASISYKIAWVVVEVSEDGEFGSIASLSSVADIIRQ